jgi:hypothetical protein
MPLIPLSCQLLFRVEVKVAQRSLNHLRENGLYVIYILNRFIALKEFDLIAQASIIPYFL